MKSLYAETQENNNYNFNNRNRNVKCNFENLFTILCNAKSGNEKSILFFIEKYQFLIKKYAFKYKLKNYDADDLIQIGNISIITAINKYDLAKGGEYIDAYIINSIKNGFKNLARNQIKYKDESSLNILIKTGDYVSEISDLIEDNINIENLVVDKVSIKTLNKALTHLSDFEKNLIKEVYLTPKGSLLKYCKSNNLSYNQTRTKLKSILKFLKESIS